MISFAPCTDMLGAAKTVVHAVKDLNDLTDENNTGEKVYVRLPH